MTKDDCVFCRIAAGEIPSNTIYEDNDVRVILDNGPASRGHALILPKEHYDDICSLDETLAARMLPLAARIGQAMKDTLGCSGFNVVQNNGRSAGQTVFHFHIHVIPRYDDGPEMVNWIQGQPTQDELAQTAAVLAEALNR